MDDAAKFKWNYSRRTFLPQVTAAIPAAALPLTSSGNTQVELHSHAAHPAKELAQDGRSTLRLLMPHGCGGDVVPTIDAFTLAIGSSVETIETPADTLNIR